MRQQLLYSTFLALSTVGGCILLVAPKLPDRCDEGTSPECDDNFLVLCQNGVEISFDCGHECRDANTTQQLCLACGDGFVEGTETCDDGNTNEADGCDANCQLECGNGFIDLGEACDDGNTAEGDGCDAACQIECGNGVLDGNETCDDGNLFPGDGCDQSCIAERCGDTRINNIDETCDDGNVTPGDGCDANCQIECGNGFIEPNEDCDDGDTINGDGCDSFCQFEDVPGEICGDGIDNDGDPFFDCDDPECDEDVTCLCAEAINLGTIALGGQESTNGDTTDRVDVFSSSCSGTFAPEQIFVITPTANGTLSINMQGASNMGFYVRTNCADPATQLVCQDSFGGGGAESIQLTVTATNSLFVFVDGQPNNFGPFTLSFILN